MLQEQAAVRVQGRCAGASLVADHQQSGAIGRINDSIAAKACLLICPDCTLIGGIGIDDDTWRSGGEQPVSKGADECRTMAAIEHVGFADELIKTARTLRLRTETDIPGAEIVTLQISKFSRICRYDELCNVRITEIAAHELELLGRVVPPLRDMRRLEPSLDRRQVGGGHRPERVGRHAQPLYNVSMVTLRLV